MDKTRIYAMLLLLFVVGFWSVVTVGAYFWFLSADPAKIEASQHPSGRLQ